ncbi:FGGY family carbohydrate kinase [Sinosporangium siamense]|uniref:Carbohydrate kinase n=1 Tax=Sinosporangium siamense TaxID=1367973 RepID=A0A919RMC6_9ACTN|nr:FGGY family carbohydrate kinase [Sinosporangium siamense]GII96441.1 carbohydrate kinase [Sinosporangium siamense]
MNILAIDQGTSSTKALVVDAGGTVLAEADHPVTVTTPAPGAVEVDPMSLLTSVVEGGRRAVAAAGVRIDGVALANQGETVLAWDRTDGKPLSPGIVWQDRRARTVCDSLADHAGRLTALTGLPLDPYFSAPKMRWLRDRLGTGAGVVTTTDTWLLHHLTGEFVTDATTASRSMLLDLDTAEWSGEAFGLFGLDEPRPRIARNDEIVGETGVYGTAVPVAGIVVDQQAALWAQRCREPGDAKCTYGTGAFLLANAGGAPVRSAHGLTSSLAWDLAGERRWCLDGQAYTAGQALTWLSTVGLIDNPADLDVLGGTVGDTAGVAFVPSLAGLGAPHWRPDATGAFVGLNLAASRAHLARAVCVGIAAQVVDLADTVAADLGLPLPRLRADGGLTRSRVLMQIQADLLQTPVEVAHAPHATALGAADLALRALTGASLPPPPPARVVTPERTAQWAQEQMAHWRSALDLTRRWSES